MRDRPFALTRLCPPACLAALAVAVAVAFAVAVAGSPPPADAAPAGARTASSLIVSSNWSGYAATRPIGASRRFKRVAGTWVQPAATCKPGTASYSAVWVGLGGFAGGSHALEQIGSEADCTREGSASYSTWLELVPAAPQNLRVDVHPGDQMSASVTITGHTVALGIDDLSTRHSIDTTRKMASPDTSSAEWIVEAPSICVGSRMCSTLALTNFGTVSFSSAWATAGQHAGTVDDPRWITSELELHQEAGATRGPRPRPRFIGVRTPVAATPSPASGPDGSFSVTWGERSAGQNYRAG